MTNLLDNKQIFIFTLMLENHFETINVLQRKLSGRLNLMQDILTARIIFEALMSVISAMVIRIIKVYLNVMKFV